MKSASLIFNILLLLLIGVLFYLHFSSPKTAIAQKPTAAQPLLNENHNCKIAYFEMDSIENSFAMVKEVKDELDRKQRSMTSELTNLEKVYRDKATNYQAKGAAMSQVQSEMAMRDLQQMQQNMQGKKQSLDQEYQDYYMRRMKDVKSKIEDFLKTYNTGKGFAYIFAYEPGLFYYQDSAYNITADVVKGLNDTYGKKK